MPVAHCLGQKPAVSSLVIETYFLRDNSILCQVQVVQLNDKTQITQQEATLARNIVDFKIALHYFDELTQVAIIDYKNEDKLPGQVRSVIAELILLNQDQKFDTEKMQSFTLFSGNIESYNSIYKHSIKARRMAALNIGAK